MDIISSGSVRVASSELPKAWSERSASASSLWSSLPQFESSASEVDLPVGLKSSASLGLESLASWGLKTFASLGSGGFKKGIFEVFLLPLRLPHAMRDVASGPKSWNY